MNASVSRGAMENAKIPKCKHHSQICFVDFQNVVKITHDEYPLLYQRVIHN